jgi:hypothetical protein
MKALLSAFSMIVSGFALGAAGLAHAGTPTACAAVAAAPADGYPSFCAIPQPPRDVRTAAQFKTAVLNAQAAGRSLTRTTARMRWSLSPGEAEPFAAQARAQAAPPPPMTPPGPDAAEFARRAREEATPPPKPH